LREYRRLVGAIAGGQCCTRRRDQDSARQGAVHKIAPAQTIYVSHESLPSLKFFRDEDGPADLSHCALLDMEATRASAPKRLVKSTAPRA
jgi:hypothetical protein